MSETGEGPESLTLDHLRALDAKLDQMAKDMARGFETVTGHLVGITGRIAGLEIRMPAMETWSADTTKRLDRAGAGVLNRASPPNCGGSG
jgi:hypothetical protein